MQTKRKVNRFFLLMFCYFVGLNAFAAGASTGLVQVLGPCIDDQTFAVVHLDVEKLDLDALVGQALSLVSEHTGPDTAKHIQDNLKNFQARAGAQLNDLLKAGGRDVFMVFSMYDFPYFFVAVPIHSANDQARLHQQIQKIAKDFNAGDIEIHLSDGLILVGLKRIIARLKTASPVRAQAREVERLAVRRHGEGVRPRASRGSNPRRHGWPRFDRTATQTDDFQGSTVQIYDLLSR